MLAANCSCTLHICLRQAFHTLCCTPRQAEVVVEAPEFMTVEYLKRRVARAKLQRGEVGGGMFGGGRLAAWQDWKQQDSRA